MKECHISKRRRRRGGGRKEKEEEEEFYLYFRAHPRLGLLFCWYNLPNFTLFYVMYS